MPRITCSSELGEDTAWLGLRGVRMETKSCSLLCLPLWGWPPFPSANWGLSGPDVSAHAEVGDILKKWEQRGPLTALKSQLLRPRNWRGLMRGSTMLGGSPGEAPAGLGACAHLVGIHAAGGSSWRGPSSGQAGAWPPYGSPPRGIQLDLGPCLFPLLWS